VPAQPPTALILVSEGGAFELSVGPPQMGDGEVYAPIVAGGRPGKLMFRAREGALARHSDPFVPAVLAPAMSRGWTVRLAEAISHEMYRGAGQVQDILCAWEPDLRRVSFECETRAAPPSSDGRGVGCFFSGGVDSFYSALKHQREITGLVLVHGFNLRLTDAESRDRVSRAMQEAAGELGKTLIEVETNVKLFSRQFVSWERVYHGSALAAVALALSPLFRKVYIPATFRYDYLIPWGSHPLLDPAWSTPSVAIVHDGCEVSRSEKVATIANNEIVQRSLRICHFNPGTAYNCGRCEKCLRTMVSLRTMGVLDKYVTFEAPLDLAAVKRMKIKRDSIRANTRFDLNRLKAGGRDPELVRAVRSALVRDTLRRPLQTYLRRRVKPLYERMPPPVRRGVDRVLGRTSRRSPARGV
jgi:hypothetical protein